MDAILVINAGSSTLKFALYPRCGDTPGEIAAHPSFAAGHRIHVPITTNPRVRFTIDGRPCRMEIGQAYEINNQKMHSVMNGGTEDRITFIFDYLPSASS